MSDCQHDNIEWLSGEEGLHIPLNGDAVTRCLDCGQIGYICHACTLVQNLEA